MLIRSLLLATLLLAIAISTTAAYNACSDRVGQLESPEEQSSERTPG